MGSLCLALLRVTLTTPCGPKNCRNLHYPSCVSVSLFTSVRLAVKLVTPAGSFTVSSMASSLMVTCHLTRHLGMTPSRLSFLKLEVELINSCITLSSLSMERRMLPTTMPEAITLLERRLLIWFWTELGNSLINVLVSKDFSCSTLSAAELDLDLLHCSWSACLLTTAKNLNLNS